MATYIDNEERVNEKRVIGEIQRNEKNIFNETENEWSAVFRETWCVTKFKSFQQLSALSESAVIS